MTTAYVVTIGDTPTHSAPTLEAAQSACLTAETRYSNTDQYDLRWNEYLTDKTWRLMSRRKDRGGRYAWTMRAIHAVEHITT